MTEALENQVETVDAVVIGAGFCGLYATWRLTEDGYSVRSFEDAPDVGGVWYWNRYPGAQTDSPGHTYQFTFDEKLLNEWRYTKKNPSWDEVLGYLNEVATRHNLRPKYHFSTRVVSATYDEDAAEWVVKSDKGHTVRAKNVVNGLGFVSDPIKPKYPGIESYGGQIAYTAKWPHEGVDFAGKRVALIGTGSTGIQIAPFIAQEAENLTVFQRTPNYAVPSGNYTMEEVEWREILDDYDKVKHQVRTHPASFPYDDPPTRSALTTPADEREKIFEEKYQGGGFYFLYEAFGDVPVDEEANELACDFLRRKIRSIVKDPATADALVPDYPYGAKRPPTEEGYFEMFNRENVDLVNLRETPIQEFTATGIKTAEKEMDIVIVAAGFDSGTGPFDKIDITGKNGRKLKDHWKAGPSTYLALGVHGFPNFFIVAGPQSPFTNLPPGAEMEGGWIVDLINLGKEKGEPVIEPTAEAESDWNKLVFDLAENSLMVHGAGVNSWFTGANIEGKPRAYYNFFGGGKMYGDLLDEERDAGYPNFEFSKS